MSANNQKLSFFEKSGYSAADAAANFVFMTMILFQLNFYTDVFGLTASAAAAILLWPRLWDAVFDPIMGVLADRTRTRWGRFRPWILWTAVPWAVVMVLAYTTPKGWSYAALIAYACITNTMLMTLYSMNNMPYSALGGVMTGDLNERARLNSFRFIAVNIAQFIVGGFTLPLVAKFAAGHAAGGTIGIGDKQYGWQMTMTIWAVLCLILFLVTFFTTRERIQPVSEVKSSPKQDFSDLLKNIPWRIMAAMTLVHFAILSFRGGALYNYYHHYADKAAMFDFVEKLGLAAPTLTGDAPKPGGLLEWLGYIVHGTRDHLAASNVADVFNSIVNMIGTATTIIVIMLSAPLAQKFGKKAVAVAGFGLSAVGTFAFYLLPPTNVGGMVALTVLIAIFYAPTIALIWAIYADVADYSELKTGRRFTGMVFATIGFTLKSGLALGSAGFLWLMIGLCSYDPQGSPMFIAGDANNIASIANAPSLASKVTLATDPVSSYLKSHLSAETQQALANYPSTAAERRAVETRWVDDLNKALEDASLYETNRFAGINLGTVILELLAKENRNQYELLSLNRLLLEKAYPLEISSQHSQPPKSKQAFRACSGIAVGVLFSICTVLLSAYRLNKRATIEMADELAARRQKATPA